MPGIEISEDDADFLLYNVIPAYRKEMEGVIANCKAQIDENSAPVFVSILANFEMALDDANRIEKILAGELTFD